MSRLFTYPLRTIIWTCRRSNAVHPANSGAAAALAAANAPTRRALKRNSRVIYGMWAIVLCYSFLVRGGLHD